VPACSGSPGPAHARGRGRPGGEPALRRALAGKRAPGRRPQAGASAVHPLLWALLAAAPSGGGLLVWVLARRF
jgi:hypothetical protein